MEATLRKFYNEIKSTSRVGEHSELLQAIEKEIDAIAKKEQSPGAEELPMREWNVPVMRIGYSYNLIAVSARTEAEAIELALDEAGGEEFSEKSSEYQAPDGAHLIQ